MDLYDDGAIINNVDIVKLKLQGLRFQQKYSLMQARKLSLKTTYMRYVTLSVLF